MVLVGGHGAFGDYGATQVCQRQLTVHIVRLELCVTIQKLAVLSIFSRLKLLSYRLPGVPSECPMHFLPTKTKA